MRAEPVIGQRVVGPVREGLPEHHVRCPACSGLLDMRRLDQLLAHEADCGDDRSEWEMSQ